MSAVLEVLVIALLAGGAFFALVGSLGLLRLSDFLRRLHGPTKASTLGVGGVLVAAILHRFASTGEIGLRELLITLFVFLTAPISAHLLAKAAMALEPGVRPTAPDDADTRPATRD
jgi:multicomponent K+:H+ antiporter subunit G